jgi:hypothetical protein
VIENALIDFIRRETNSERPVGLIEDTHDFGEDPTDGWREWIDFKDAIRRSPRANLVVAHEFGYVDRELGPNGAVVCVQRNRAEASLQSLFAA